MIKGGIAFQSSSRNVFSNASNDDVCVYTATSGQNLILGHQDRAAPAVSILSNNDVNFDADTIGNNSHVKGEIMFYTGGGISETILDTTLEQNYIDKSISASNVSFLTSEISGVPDLTVPYNDQSYTIRIPTSVTMSSNVTIGQSESVGLLTILSQSNMSNISNVSVVCEGKILANNDILTSSDTRLKSDMKVLVNALNIIESVHGYRYNMNDGIHVGVAAQEFAAVLPEVVNVGPDGYMTVAYGNMNALLIQSIKELKRNDFVTDITTTTDDESFSIKLPDNPDWDSSLIWTHVIISCCSGYSRCFASIDSGYITGKCEKSGKYCVKAYGSR